MAVERTATCANCGAQTFASVECPDCGVILAKAEARRHKSAAAPELPILEANAIAEPKRPLLEARIVQGTRVIPLFEVLAIPAALLLGALVQLSALGKFLVYASAEMELHELGHASAMWFAGRLAVPLPMVTLGSNDRSVLGFLLVGAALAGIVLAARREQLVPLHNFALVLLALLPLQEIFFAGERFDAWVKFAGVGGEFWLSALLLIAFHLRLPAGTRWSTSRWFFLVWGALAFAANSARWIRGEIPHGSFWGGDGDMELLLSRPGWSDSHLISVYRGVGVLCAFAIATQWALVVRAWKKSGA